MERTIRISIKELKRIINETLQLLSEVSLEPGMDRLISHVHKSNSVLATRIKVFFYRLVSDRISEFEREEMRGEIRDALSRMNDGSRVSAYFDNLVKSHIENAQGYHKINDLISSTLGSGQQKAQSRPGSSKDDDVIAFKSIR